MTEKKPHKFKPVTNGASGHDWAVYCEYCGLIAFYANRSSDMNKQYQEAKQGCPCSPPTVTREVVLP